MVEAIIDFLRVDFVVVYFLKLLKSPVNNNISAVALDIFEIITKRIMERICDDLCTLNRFVDKWSYLILETDRMSSLELSINQIYEKLIFVNKEFRKL